MLFSVLVDASKGSQHHRERAFTFVDQNTCRVILFQIGIHALYAIECAKSGNLIALFLALHHQEQGIHTIVFTPVHVLRPRQSAIGKPWLLPAVTTIE